MTGSRGGSFLGSIGAILATLKRVLRRLTRRRSQAAVSEGDNATGAGAPSGSSYRFPEIVPAHWFEEGDEPAVWLRAYLTMGIPMTAEKHGVTHALEDLRVCVHVRYGSFTAPPPIRIVPTGGGKFARAIGAQRTFPDDVYLVLVTPVDSKFEGEAKAKRLLDSVAGMLVATLSPNMTYMRLFEHGEFVKEGRSLVPSEVIRNPAAYRNPDLTQGRLARALEATMKAPESLQNRVFLSARWLAEGVEENLGVDAFLKLWIAIEALALESTTKTKPLVVLLAAAYGKDQPWVNSNFKIDRLAQHRSNVVHNGAMPTIRGDTVRFLVALYEDALAAKLGLPFERRAEAFIGSDALKFL